MESTGLNTEAADRQVKAIQRFYRLHARLYQSTRWSFLFGRKRLINALHLPPSSEGTVLEVGCGTGHNLFRLAKRHPDLRLIGVDVSPDMLRIARQKLQRFSRRVLFIEKPYAPGPFALLSPPPDAILFSYCLTMFNPGWEGAIERAAGELAPGGLMAAVDFHGTPFARFRRWMTGNQVRMDGHLLPAFENRFTTVYKEVRKAYGGLWTYFLFIGKK